MTILNKELYTKYINNIFSEFSTNWFTSIIYWTTDSKYRKKQRVTKFLKNQIDEPDKNAIELANQFTHLPHREKVVKVFEHMYNNYFYMSDSVVHGMLEKWVEAKILFKIKKGDCEDLNGMAWVVCVLAGVPEELLFSVIGDVDGIGHYWCYYYDITKDKVFIMDSTYYPDFRSLSVRELSPSIKEELYDPKYIFNSQKAFKFNPLYKWA